MMSVVAQPIGQVYSWFQCCLSSCKQFVSIAWSV